MPLLPSCIVGGVSALGRIKRQVVPPFAGMLTLSATRMLFQSVTFMTNYTEIPNGWRGSLLHFPLYVSIEFRAPHLLNL